MTSLINLYEVIALSAEPVPAIPVFATSYDMAAHYYAIWWMSHRAGDMPDIEIRKRNPGWPGLHVTLLHEALKRNQAGIGRFDAETGWTILMPGHNDLEDI